MRRGETEKVRELTVGRGDRPGPARRRATTKQMHERLLRALSDRRLKRAFGD